ncbi:MAG: hypothetical protein ACLT8E_01090 [Akkermansia sp.]
MFVVRNQRPVLGVNVLFSPGGGAFSAMYSTFRVLVRNDASGCTVSVTW